MNQIVVPLGASGVISFCGSATYKLGIEGKLDLYYDDDGDSRIASLYWKGPWPRCGNRFEITNHDTKKYLIIMSPIHRNGVLGEVSITVNQVGP